MHRIIRGIHSAVAAACITGSALSGAWAADSTSDEKKPEENKTVVFDHAMGLASQSFIRQVKDGGTITVKIINTATNCFDYNVLKAPIAPQAGALGEPTKILTITHEKEYGGYIVQITPVANPNDACKKSSLKGASLMIFVETSDIEVAFGGGFTVSSLTDKVYAARTDPNTGNDVVVRDQAAEDDFALGVAALIHVYGNTWPKWVPAISFGLGVSESSTASYYIGPFWRIGKQAFIGGGIVFGSVDRLPSGVQEGDVITDPNLLARTDSKIDSAAFFGLSYTFLGGGQQAFQKPFQTAAGTEPAPSSGKGGGQAPPDGTEPCAKHFAYEIYSPQKDAKIDITPPQKVKIVGKLDCILGSGEKLTLTVRDGQNNERGDAVDAKVEADGTFSKEIQVKSIGESQVHIQVKDSSNKPVPGAEGRHHFVLE
jgi:hypothetical protein